MEIIPNEDQRALKDSIERLLANRYDIAQRADYARESAGWSREMWQQYAGLGLLGLTIAERHGGFGFGAAEVTVVMEAFGHALVLEPWLSTVVVGAQAIALAGSAPQQEEWLPKIAAGRMTIAWAHAEQALSGDFSRVLTTATSHPAGWLLHGAKTMVAHGDFADRLLVSARLPNDELALFLVDPASPCLTRESFATQDGLRAAHVYLTNVVVAHEERLGAVDAARVIEQLCDLALAAICAEAVGVLQEMLDLTVEYLKTRKQFGVVIGSFQVLQHRAVDMLVAVDAARSMALFATAMATESNPLERRRAMAAAKVQIGRSARFVGQQAVQLHGGMGVSMEAKVAQCFLRSTAIEHQFGGTEYHLRSLARLGGLIPAREPG